MTTNPQENPSQVQEAAKVSDKELNFRKQEAMYQRMLEERDRRLAEIEERLNARKNADDDDEDDDTFIDRKKLEKKLSKFGEQTQKQTQSEIQKAVQLALADERRQNWLKSNPDFREVMQHAEKFAEKDPELAETILEMPDGFERQKLVYKTIKAMGLHKPEEKQSTIQDKVNQNKRSPYYQPSGVGSAPYAGAGDFSQSGQKNAYEKLQELKRNLRI
jgi:hypothetical protein